VKETSYTEGYLLYKSWGMKETIHKCIWYGNQFTKLK